MVPMWASLGAGSPKATHPTIPNRTELGRVIISNKFIVKKTIVVEWIFFQMKFLFVDLYKHMYAC
jgi:hypothetical protein